MEAIWTISLKIPVRVKIEVKKQFMVCVTLQIGRLLLALLAKIITLYDLQVSLLKLVFKFVFYC